MIIEIYGELLYDRAIEDFISSFSHILKTVSDKPIVDYTRFAFYAVDLMLTIPLKEFWRNNELYNGLVRLLNTSFDNWEFNISLYINERKD